MRADFPPEVLRLFRREREIAEIIYSAGLATAKDVQASLSDPLSNAATRSMLNRLVRKNVLARHRKEASAEYVYRPAITLAGSKEKALKQLADDFFGGSLQDAASLVAELARRTGRAHHQAA